MEQHPTSNIERSTSNAARVQFLGRWMLNVGCWMLLGSFYLFSPALAQSPTPQPDPLLQLMLSQPPIEIATNIEVRAVFDPPVVALGEKAIYRVTINTVNDSIRWPEEIYAPGELAVKQSSRGQFLQPAGATIKPVTMINHHVTASAIGELAIPEFKVKVGGKNVSVPAARLTVAPNPIPNAPSAKRLVFEVAQTNIFSGQPVKVRIILPPGEGNSVQALQQVQLNGDGILMDQSSVRQRVQPLTIQGRTGPAFIVESTLTPLVAGEIDVAAQAFTAGNQFFGGITISGSAVIPGGQPQYTLLDSDPVRLNVEPLPRGGMLPGFTGGIGEFKLAAVQLKTDRLVVGEATKLLVTLQTDGDIKRLLAPPPPTVTNWQIFPALADGGMTMTATTDGISSAQTFSYTMIPLTNDIRNTPEIPFSYFDPVKRIYVDLSIPELPVTVVAGNATAEAQAMAQAAAAKTARDEKLSLSGLASSRGKSAATLKPAQVRVQFWVVQLGVLICFSGLWLWDRQRRYYEAHPEVLIRKRALRALRRERAALDKAARARLATPFSDHALAALRIASAPHFPALPRALVGSDVLSLLSEKQGGADAGNAVKSLFDSADRQRYDSGDKPVTDLLGLKPGLDAALDELEGRLR